MELEVPQVPVEPLAEQVSHVKFRAAFKRMDLAMTTQANRKVISPMNLIVGTTTKKVRDFTRMNPSEFRR